ncbi:MAG: hypothetical protein IKE62_04380 [Oscillospiraceae bacterium]|nr:hypothetical protein [Oscillospiraceae bacterium]
MEEKKLYSRMAAVAVCIAACIIICVVNLIDLQVINGETNLKESEKYIVTTKYTVVNAARGQVFDCNGVPMITNKTVYSLGFEDITFAEDDYINSTIYSLLVLCTENGVAHSDTLPLNSNLSDYITVSSTNQERFDSFVARFGWSQELTAQELAKKMCDLYSLDPARYDMYTLRQLLGVRYEITLRNILNISPYVFATDIDTSLIACVQERGYDLVSVTADSTRVYSTKYAAHLLGYTGKMSPEEYEKYGPLGYDMDEIVGISGIEKAFEEYLHGQRGLLETKTNAQGNIVSERYIKEPSAGADVYLTIDLNVQAAAENSLAKCIERLHSTGSVGLGQEAKGGAVVAIDVNTFDILAMASFPTYDMSTYSEKVGDLVKDSLSPLLNRATQGLYEPGSTFKMVTAIAALETGAINTNTYIEDQGIYNYYAPSYTPACWIYTRYGYTHGTLNVSEALENSCNYFFYEAGRLTGIDSLNKYAALFGLGQSTGIETDESTGILAGPESSEERGRPWTAGDTIQAAIGQSDNIFSPLQMACYIGTLANGGNRYAAHTLKMAISSTSGDVLRRSQKELVSSAGISAENYAAVMSGMLEASATGTAANVFSDYPIQVASKTGSAQTGLTSDNAVFVCCAPYDAPEIAVVVVVEEGGQGSLIGSVAKDVLDSYFYVSSTSGVQTEGSLIQ